jgi:hypothetical protein
MRAERKLNSGKALFTNMARFEGEKNLDGDAMKAVVEWICLKIAARHNLSQCLASSNRLLEERTLIHISLRICQGIYTTLCIGMRRLG